MVGRQSPLSVCLFSVFATLLAAMCERIHTLSLSSIPGSQGVTAELGVQGFIWLFTSLNVGMDSYDWGQIK